MRNILQREIKPATDPVLFAIPRTCRMPYRDRPVVAGLRLMRDMVSSLDQPSLTAHYWITFVARIMIVDWNRET